MKRLVSFLLVVSIMFSVFSYTTAETASGNSPDFIGMGDPALPGYIENTLYQELVADLRGEQYYVENVSALYISQEYLDELAYNSQANIFFGYTLADLDAQFQGEKYVFTLGDNRETVVEPFRDYDDTYDRIIHNVAVGAGVILVSVTVTAIGAVAGAPAITMIFAVAATTGTKCALAGATIGGISAGIVTGIKTGDMSQALKAAALTASEGFKWGAITGAISGAALETAGLWGATLNGLTMDEAALIQLESGYPLDVIQGFTSMEQYEICKEAGLMPQMVDGRMALIREIDLDFVDEFGRTNLQRMKDGLAALDPATGQSYQLHHIGQKMDSTLSILTEAEHMQGGNNLIWHELGGESQIDRAAFASIRQDFWMDMASILGGV